MLYNLVSGGVGVAVDAKLLHMLWEPREEKGKRVGNRMDNRKNIRYPGWQSEQSPQGVVQ